LRNAEEFLIPAFPELFEVGKACLIIMPVDTWWGIKFLDAKYLFSFEKSPALEVLESEFGFRVKLSGSHRIDLGLSTIQIEAIQALGFSKAGSSSCDCFPSSWGGVTESPNSSVSALNILSSVYGV
jgi:hypothetical protein